MRILMSLWTVLGGLMFPGLALGQQPAAAPTTPTEEKEFLHDTFQESPDARYQNVDRGAGASVEWKKGSYQVKGLYRLAKQVRVGAVAELTAKLEFPPLLKNGEKSETQLSFVVLPTQLALASLTRQRTGDHVVATIRLFRGRTNDVELLREVTLPGDLPNGLWTLRFRYGLLRVDHNDRPLAWGYFETGINSVVGIAWGQQEGQATWRQLRLRGGSFPPDRTAQELEDLATAAQLNTQGLQLYQQKKYAEAITCAKQALDLYRKVLGENACDTASVLDNLGFFHYVQEQYAEAKPYFERALKVRQLLLTEDHPDTANVWFHLGGLFYDQGKYPEARPYLEKAASGFAKSQGPESKLARLMEFFPKLKESAK
jgi:tetratricopeptide (TPR) repeat protein